MALNAYLATTKALLQLPAAPSSLYDPVLLTSYINEARNWVAAESASVRVMGTLTLPAASNGPLLFANVVTTSVPGVASVLDVRSIWYQSGTGQVWVTPRPWDWFAVYELNAASLGFGPPGEWAQYSQGVNGSVYFNVIADQGYSLNLDCVCLPIPLVVDATVEAIPYPWTDAVPFYAAYKALLSAQSGARMEDAQRMLQLYELYVSRARKYSTPDVLPMQYSQAGLPPPGKEAAQ